MTEIDNESSLLGWVPMQQRRDGGVSTAPGFRPLRLGRWCLGWLWLLGVTTAVQGQGNPGSALRTNEVEVQITFIMNSKTDSGGGSGSELGENHFSADSLLKVTGRFAARLNSPSPGKRTLLLTRRLPGELVGTFSENLLDESIGDVSEGGFQFDVRTVRREEWKNSGVDLAPGVDFVLELNLDDSTWTFPSLPDAVEGWVRDVLRGHQFLGSYYGPKDGKWSWVILSPRAPQGLDTASSYLGVHWFKARVPMTLLHTGDAYSGESGIWSVPLEKEYIAAWSLSWKVLAAVPEVELRVTSPKLQQWRPEAGRDPKGSNARLRGKPLDLIAEVVSPSGANVSALRIRKMRWWLEDTSRLPGAAMNWPYGSNDTSPDLEIGHARATAERQELELTFLTTLRSKIQIVPYDWGGSAVLRVEAELDDGRTLQGKLKGQSGDETAIRLPASEETSKVSSRWKRQLGVADMADDEDTDSIPAGGPNGDGLTLFEEYRGFYAEDPNQGSKPVHVSTRPRAKTVFVYDRIHDDHTPVGISQFRAASRAQVLVIKPESGLLDESRVINRNPGDAPSKGPQHAIGIRRGPSWLPKSPGSPGAADVEVPTFEEIMRLHPTLARTDLYERAIAQRLLTACRVGKPGEGDRLVTLTVSRGIDGGPVVMTDGGERVTLRAEATGHDLGEDWLKEVEQAAAIARANARVGLRGSKAANAAAAAGQAVADVYATKPLYVAVRGGEHSGPLGNIMRNAHAEAYRIEGTDTIVELPKPTGEKIGYQLTTTSEGDGYNKPTWDRPRTRYSSSQQPPSRSQFNVSDHTP